jgi:DNA-binding FrmR family transcriptional regulator
LRGAVNGLMVQLLQDHVRLHVAVPSHDRDPERAQGAMHLIDVVHAYLK